MIKILSLVTAVILAFPLSSCENNDNMQSSVAEGYNSESGVIVGSDGWLFLGKDSHGVDNRIADFKGETKFTEAELETIKKNLTSKRSFFSNNDAELFIAIIPDKMNLYSDMLPEDIDGDGTADTKPEVTRAQQVYDYLKENSRFDIAYLYDALSEASATDSVFEKTSDSLTDYGVMCVSREIIKYLNEYLVVSIGSPTEDMYAISEETVTDGTLATALCAGLGMDNNTLTETVKKYTYKGELPYADDTLEYESISATSIIDSAKAKDNLYIRAVLYASSDIEKYAQFMSPNFAKIGYKRGLDTDLLLISKIKPNKAIMIIRESELETLSIDLDAIAQAVADDPTVTVAPTVTASFFSHETGFAVYGVTEEGATITAVGGTEDVIFTTEDGIFVFVVPVNNDTNRLYLTSSKEGKSDSAIVTVEVNQSLDKSDKWSVVGLDGHMHVKETVFPSEVNEANLKTLAKRIELQYKYIKEVSPDTTLVYFIAPDHCTVYPETLPDRFRDTYISASTSVLRQLTEYFKDSDIVFLDPTDYLKDHKENEFGYIIYQKTDSHWNELGAFYGYTYLMNKIAENYPAAAPKPITDFKVFKESIPGGDLLNSLGLNLDINREISVFVRPETFTSSLNHEKDYRMNFENAWSSDNRVYKFDDREDMPTAIMYRDSFSTNLMMYMVENFSKIEFVNMWNYSVNIKKIAEEQPDYVIIESVQRNMLGNIGQWKK